MSLATGVRAPPAGTCRAEHDPAAADAHATSNASQQAAHFVLQKSVRDACLIIADAMWKARPRVR